MKSDVIKVTNEGERIDLALQAASASAAYRGLEKKNTIRLQLLAEEMLGMIRQITGETEADFWVESEGKRFELHLTVRSLVTGKMRKELLKASTSGKNDAAKGFMGKVRDIIDNALTAEDISHQPEYYMQGLVMPSDADMNDPVVYSVTAGMASWSLRSYKAAVGEESSHNAEAKAEWDELEKSIVANIADEVKIYIAGSDVEMIVYKNFESK